MSRQPASLKMWAVEAGNRHGHRWLWSSPLSFSRKQLIKDVLAYTKAWKGIQEGDGTPAQRLRRLKARWGIRFVRVLISKLEPEAPRRSLKVDPWPTGRPRL